MHSCFSGRLNVRHYAIVHQLLNKQSNQINKFLIQSINEDVIGKKIMEEQIHQYYQSYYIKSEKSEESEEFSLNYNFEFYSIGDVLFALSALESVDGAEEIQLFIEAVRIIYSIILIEILFIDVSADNLYYSREKARGLLGNYLYIDNELNKKVQTTLHWEGENNKYYNEIFTKDFLIQLIVQSYPIDSGNPAYKFNYTNRYNPGSTRTVKINFISAFINILSIKMLRKRTVNIKSPQINNLVEYSQKYISPIPIWSLDFVNSFFKELGEKYRVRRQNPKMPLNNFISNISELPESIDKMSPINISKEIKRILEEGIATIQNDRFNNETEKVNEFFSNSISERENNEKAKGSSYYSALLNSDLESNDVFKLNLSEKTANEKVKYFTLFSNVYYEEKWKEVLIKVMEIFIKNKPNNFNKILELCNHWKTLKISNCQQKEYSRLNIDIKDDNYKNGVWVHSHLSAQAVITNCIKIIQVCGFNPENVFAVYCINKKSK